MNVKNKSNKVLFILGFIWILIAFFLIWFDLQISLILVDQNSSWAKFLRDYGEVPGFIVILIALTFLFQKWEIKNRSIYFLGLVIISLLQVIIFGGMIYVTNLYTNFASDYQIIFIIIIISVPLVINYLLWQYKFKTTPEIDSFTKITLILAIINPLLFVQITKIIWGRIRFRDLNSNFSDFTPWYLPQGITGQNSFPSGHASMAWMVLPLTIFFRKNPNKYLKYLSYFLIILNGFVVSISRVVIGAHYASDILFSSMVAIITFFILYRKYS